MIERKGFSRGNQGVWNLSCFLLFQFVEVFCTEIIIFLYIFFYIFLFFFFPHCDYMYKSLAASLLHPIRVTNARASVISLVRNIFKESVRKKNRFSSTSSALWPRRIRSLACTGLESRAEMEVNGLLFVPPLYSIPLLCIGVVALTHVVNKNRKYVHSWISERVRVKICFFGGFGENDGLVQKCSQV